MSELPQESEGLNQKRGVPQGKMAIRIPMRRRISALLLRAHLLSIAKRIAPFQAFQLRVAGHS
jgi:hypothetical protein